MFKKTLLLYDVLVKFSMEFLVMIFLFLQVLQAASDFDHNRLSGVFITEFRKRIFRKKKREARKSERKKMKEEMETTVCFWSSSAIIILWPTPSGNKDIWKHKIVLSISFFRGD